MMLQIRPKDMKDLAAKVILVVIGFIIFTHLVFVGIVQNISASFESLMKALVFGTFVFVGHKLIGNIFKESERKAEVESLNEQLAILHDDLEGTVLERTQALSEAKLHSETILENLTLGIIEYDESFTVLRVNRAAEDMLGIERHIILGNIIQPQDKKAHRLSSLAVVLYPGISEGGHKVHSKEEFEKYTAKNELTLNYPKKRDIQITTIQLNDAQAKNGQRFIKLIRDVTRENEARRSKSEFIKIAAHQLRTPLAGTKWALRTTLDGDIGPTSKKQQDILQKAYDMNKSLIDIVNNLLNVEQIEEDFGYHMVKGDILPVVKEAIRSSLLLARDKKLNIQMKKSAGVVSAFEFDQVKILLAVKNVVANAIDYTPEGGTISVLITMKDNNCVVEVTDTGIGISEEDAQHLFTKFYRAQAARKIAPTRSGLGLFITKNIVESHGGTVTIEKAGDSGTTVRISLPVKSALQT